MAGVNKVIIIGNLGRDPEIMYTQQGLAVVRLAVATSEVWIDKNTNERQEKTEWHRITVFGKQAENCEKFLAKGRQVYVEGRLETSSYEKDGQTHYSTGIIANTVQFLGGRQDGGSFGGGQGGGSFGGGQGGSYQPQRQAPPPSQGGGAQGGNSYQGGGWNNAGSNNSASSQSPVSPGNQGGVPEDDIPF
ncbi:Single-stranded DNA-binding protein [Desulfamplus magnetovallimortis]|uniref:Single-stranded DNA-binding protein n=1 Tax=Desulfamplus magnetovallimortis TaxID=1246637 RepID=A0A1W1H8U1_9BACT|nr:single-stranded DNA-binding protein [Desulfamplus magnetovallimortis]SLM28891.1 Single-stranded DNA-binding protein [Desulfamplus magnetovallimortis]